MTISYPEKPITVGDHIRKKRMELKLKQNDVAEVLNVTGDCLCNWENNRNEPRIKFYSKIYDFLGYLPIDIETSTFAGKLKSYRYKNGLSQKQLGKILNIDGSTIAAWEKNESQPQRGTLNKLEVLLGTTLDFPKQRKKLYHFSCPERPLTLGDHIRKKRIELNLYQSEVAKIINVSADKISLWETNTSCPQIIHYPQIIKFLGHFPFEVDTSTMAGRLISYRYRNGLTQVQVGKILKVSKNSVSAWEKGLYVPQTRMLKKVERLLAKGHLAPVTSQQRY